MVTTTMNPMKRIKRKTGVRIFHTGHRPMVTLKQNKISIKKFIPLL